MDMKNLNNINKSAYLTEKVGKIIKDLESIKDYEIQDLYKDCQVLLDFINAFLLAQKFNIKIENYDMVKIINEYVNIDQNLLEEMTTIVGENNTIENITVKDVEFLINKIDHIYGYMQEKYGIKI